MPVLWSRAMRAILLLLILLVPLPALAQSCPAPLAGARKLVLVTALDMASANATLQRFNRPSPQAPWKADGGASVEIYHGNHRQLETRSPVNAFVPYTIDNKPYLLAGYTCTPLVKFQIADLKPGEKVRGTTIAEFGAGNRVLDMIVYRKGEQEFLLTANNSRGVMKIPTKNFANATPITTPVESETGGVPFEKITSMTGIEQLEKLDDNTSIVIARSTTGGISLKTVPLP